MRNIIFVLLFLFCRNGIYSQDSLSYEIKNCYVWADFYSLQNKRKTNIPNDCLWQDRLYIIQIDTCNGKPVPIIKAILQTTLNELNFFNMYSIKKFQNVFYDFKNREIERGSFDYRASFIENFSVNNSFVGKTKNARVKFIQYKSTTIKLLKLGNSSFYIWEFYYKGKKLKCKIALKEIPNYYIL